MEDFPQLDTGKRKRSPADSLVDVPIPFPYDGPNQAEAESSVILPEKLPLPKRPRLPEKPPVPEPETSSTLNLVCLPPGVLQAIFSYLDPPSLGRLVRANRVCRNLLDSKCTLPTEQTLNFSYRGRTYGKNACFPRLQDTVWQTSRRRHAPSMPRPMEGLSERELFALAFGITCRFCGALPVPVATKSHGTWRPTPVGYSVFVIWPFKLRSCMQCLVPRLRKDSDVMMSDASPLRPALSFAFFTQSMQYVPQSRWRESVAHDMDLQKYYYAPEIELLQQEAKSVQGFGSAAAEEWIKGLPLRGQLTRDFVTQLEDWQLNGGLEETRSLLSQHTEPPKKASRLTTLGPLPVTSTFSSTSAVPLPLPNALPVMPLQAYSLAPGMDAPHGLPPKPSDASSMGSQTSNHRLKTAPSSQELARSRAYKKVQIIEKCSALIPPIHRDMLERLEAYHNALQIPMPLNEFSWETLKSLLLTQRKQTKLQDEARNSVTTAPIPGQFTAPSRSDEYVLAHADAPVKDKLCEIAKEYIKQKFGHGGWVTYPTAPQFAADVLMHTRETFLKETGRIKALRSYDVGTQQDEVLRYEHMKWVFDQTIKPQTEQIRRELFLCARCPPVNGVKYFAFESMIQHYAFKHDPAFTGEAPKAFWKCEWPEMPPFNVHPERVHTPEPTITHTPTLSYQPLPIMSPSSNLHTMVPPGRRTPDTMSLLSGNTNPFSASGRSVRMPSQVVQVLGPAMYELQRDSLATEMRRGWKLITSAPGMPLSLQLYLTLGFAIASFSKKYKNEPSLKMLEDCLSGKSELYDLHELKDLEPLRCAECVLDGRIELQTEWSLQDLIVHFRKMHVENNISAAKVYWKDNMLYLPEPVFIKGLLSNDDIPTVLQNLLQDAETTAVIQKATTVPTKSQPVTYSESFRDLRQALNSFSGPPMMTLVEGRQIYQPTSHLNNQYTNPRALPFSAAATYDDSSLSRDTWSASSRTIKAEDLSSVGSNRPVPNSRGDDVSYSNTAAYFERPLPSIETNSLSASRRFAEPPGEAMSRSETRHSQRSRGENMSQNITDDFLSAIDAQLDIEMEGSGLGDERTSHMSHPVSRTNSARAPSTRISLRTSMERGEEAEHRRLSTSNAAIRHQQAPYPNAQRDESSRPATFAGDGLQAMARQSSRVIEFDHHGNPVISAGEIYQEVSPPRTAVHRHYLNEFNRPAEAAASSHGHGAGIIAHSAFGMDYIEDQRQAHPYAPLEYAPAQMYRPERVVDSVTGQLYFAEPPVMRATNDSGGPRMLYDDMGRHVRYEYLGADYDAHGPEDSRYERPPSGYYGRRYQGR